MNFVEKLIRKAKRKYFRLRVGFGFMTVVDHRHRGIGKTTILLEHAKKNDAPVIVGNYMTKRAIEHLAGANGVKVYVFTPFYLPNLRGLRFPNGVYIDESVTPQSLKLLRKHFKVRVNGGFQKSEEA
jgi:hypothetical protein